MSSVWDVNCDELYRKSIINHHIWKNRFPNSLRVMYIWTVNTYSDYHNLSVPQRNKLAKCAKLLMNYHITRDYRWFMSFGKLVEFYRIHQYFPRCNDPINPILGNWCANQRSYRARGGLDDFKINLFTKYIPTWRWHLRA